MVDINLYRKDLKKKETKEFIVEQIKNLFTKADIENYETAKIRIKLIKQKVINRKV